MNRQMGIGLVVGAVLATTGGALAGFKLFDREQPAPVAAALTQTQPTAPAPVAVEPEPIIEAPEEPQFAEVLDVSQITKTVRVPRQVCSTEAVTRQAPVQDRNQVTGTIVGAVIGGVLGNQVGDGRGRKLATAAGAAAGGYAGNRVQRQMQQGNTYMANEQRCTTVYDTREEPQGFDVRYRLGEEEGKVRMSYNPGDRIPVQDGELVTSLSKKSRR